MLSNFEKVQEFNKAFEMKTNDTPNRNIFTEDPDNVKLALSLITEEVKELEDAIKDHDFGEVRDAVADILYVVYGLADRFGIDADADFAEVHDSNMSKLCISEEEAKATVLSYEKKFNNKESPYDSPYYYKVTNAKGEDRWLVKNKSTGKALKSINYNAVNFN
jgi:predicted HAD superfamily Cof-like phosphohydrolase